jgi:membrane-associated progesterone receptor component
MNYRNFVMYSAILLIIHSLLIVASDVVVESQQQQSEVSVDEVGEVDASASSNSSEAPAEKVRMITKEELALHDGNQTSTLWLSILSQVYDVSAGPEYYSPTAPYRVFVGRDGNVPFITGTFKPEEAEKPLTDLEPHQLHALHHWSEFYRDEPKYNFVGLLIGELYDEDGNPTEAMRQVQEKIVIANVQAEERKKKTAEIIERRRREMEEKKKRSKE